jgi:hypothetical protein
MEKLMTSRVLFLGEQDGVVERELKAYLVEHCFASQRAVSSAYLARVSYQETPGPAVALCLWGGKENAAAIVESIGAAFRRQFNAAEHLDIFFMDELQRQAIDKVAKPFYVA